MKIDPHAALLAAQNLRTLDTTARGRQASANFFAELKKAGNSPNLSSEVKTANSSATNSTSTNAPAANLPLPEAPLRSLGPSQTPPPGSLLNILV